MSTRLNFGPGDRVTIWVDDQRLSRITHAELREIILQSLVFGGKKLRTEVQEWLNGGAVDKVADAIAPPAEAALTPAPWEKV